MGIPAAFVSLVFVGGCDNSAAERLRTCEGGNTEACYNDGMAALSAAKPDFGAARKAFSSACRPSVGTNAASSISQARPAACNELALLVRDAKGGPKDIPRAIDLFGIACKDGNDRACVDLGALLFPLNPSGLVYSEDKGKAEDAVRAVVLFDAACAKVDTAQAPADGPHPLAQACESLGRAYEAGVGVEPPRADVEKAATLYTKACDAKYAPGCVGSGLLLVATKDKKKIASGAELYERACKLDPHFGCFELAELHANKSWPDASDALAVEYYKKTCNIDPTRGCFEAGAMMEEGRVADREEEVDSLYNLACEHGSSAACERRAMRR